MGFGSFPTKNKAEQVGCECALPAQSIVWHTFFCSISTFPKFTKRTNNVYLAAPALVKNVKCSVQGSPGKGTQKFPIFHIFTVSVLLRRSSNTTTLPNKFQFYGR